MDKQNWNKFVSENNGSFLQSWEWGRFQESFGRKVFRFSNCHPEFISGSHETLKQVQGDDNIIWCAQFIENKLPGVNKFYWHCPRGPVMAKGQEQMANGQLPEIIEEVKKAAGKDVIFFRLGPEWGLKSCHSSPASAGEESLANAGRPAKAGRDLSALTTLGLGMTQLGFRQLHYDIEPSQTLILDITKSEDELLAQMHEKWRYNIRLAERKGVQVKLLVSESDNFDKYFEEFYRLVSKGTAERKRIKHHPKEYYRKQLEIGKNPPQPSLKGRSDSPPLGGVRGDFRSHLFVAEYENQVVAVNIVVFFGKIATYLHGATDNNFRNLMAPHLLQWEQIKYAKAQGCSEYDFWGIVNEHTLDKRGKSWEGFTRFKRGFGGREVNYAGYWDYPLDKKWYFLYRLVQKLRR